MLNNIFVVLTVFIFGCDKLSIDRVKDKVFSNEGRPITVSDFRGEVALLDKIEISRLINLSFQLDKKVYEAIKQRGSENSLGDIAELVNIATDEEKMVCFLKGEEVSSKINEKIGIEIEGEMNHTYMLHLALDSSFHPTTIELMLEKGALLLKDSAGNTPLFLAIERRQNSLISRMLENDTIDIDATNEKGLTAIQYLLSLEDENLSAVELMLKAGADIRVKNVQENELNALHYAVLSFNIESVKLILESIEDIEERREYIKSCDRYGRTALHFASILGHIDMWLVLVEELNSDIYVFTKDNIGATELHYAALSRDIIAKLKRRSRRPKFIRLLSNLKKEFALDILCRRAFKVDSIDRPEIFGYSIPKEEIIIEGSKNESLFLKTDRGGLTPIHYVVLTGNVDLLELVVGRLRLVDREFLSKHNLKSYIPLELEVEKRRDLIKGATPFDIACIAEKVEVVEYMLGLLKEINEKEDEEREATLELVKLLGVVSKEGTTPLHYAALVGNIDICKMLIKNPYTKEQKRVKNEEGKRAIDISEERKDIEVLYTFITDGEEVSRQLLSLGLMLREEREKGIYEELLKMTGVRRDEIVEKILEGVEEVKEGGKTGLMHAIDAECKLKVLKKIVTRMKAEELLRRDLKGDTLEDYVERLEDKRAGSYVVKNYRVRDYILKLYDVNKRVGEDGWTELMAASYGGNEEVVNRLLSKGVNIDAKYKYDWTALIIAAEKGHSKVVETLLAYGTNIESTEQDGATALIIAAQYDNYLVVKILLEHNANIEAINRDGFTALIVAAQQGNEQIVKILLDRGANIEAKNRDEFTALMIAAQNGHYKTVETLLDNSADIEANVDGWTALMIAVECNHDQIVRLLIRNGANIEAVNDLGNTALIIALQNNRVKVLETLLEYNANIDVKDRDGWTALMIAAEEGNYIMLKTLLDRGANIEAVNKDGITLLMLAIEGKYSITTRILLKYNLNIEAKDREGCTALMRATQSGDYKPVVKLLGRNANIEAANKDGWTSLMIAAEEGYYITMGLLLECGANIEATENSGNTVLMIAAKKGHYRIVQTLLEYNANIRAKNKSNETALDLAIQQGNLRIIKLLSEKNRYFRNVLLNLFAKNKACIGIAIFLSLFLGIFAAIFHLFLFFFY